MKNSWAEIKEEEEKKKKKPKISRLRRPNEDMGEHQAK